MATKAVAKNSGKIAAFVANYSNKSSASGYKAGIESFLRCMFNLDKLDENGHKITHDYETKFEEYLAECKAKQDVINQTHDQNKKAELVEEYKAMLKVDFMKFSQCLSTECSSKQSAREIMTKARLVLSVHEVKVPDEAIMHLKRELKGGRANQLPDMTGKMICSIVKGADVRGRAIILMLASSGLRINELLAVKFKGMVDITQESTSTLTTAR